MGATAAAGLGVSAAEAQAAAGSKVMAAKPGSPNILIFMPDQQNGSTVDEGSQVIKPHMDRFRGEAVTFTSAHCPAPHCCPSRASFMSGLYPSEHGVYNNVSTDTAIHPNPYPGTPFWGSALKANGYQMGYAGKLHVGRDVTPETCGFTNLSALEQDNFKQNQSAKLKAWTVARSEKSDPAERRPGQILRPGWPRLDLYGTNTMPNAFEDLADTKIMRAGVAGMQKMAAAKEPWCVMISNSGGHDNYVAPKQFVDMYAEREIKLPENFTDLMEDKPRVYQRQRYEYWSQLSDAETKDCLLHYWAKLTMQDQLFGDMLKALEETGQADNTIVIYVSDHGDYGAAHGLWMKGVPAFQEAYHIPCVIRWPKGMKQPGRNVEAFVDQVDFASTILDACGIASPKPLSGSSLLPWMRAETPAEWRHATFSQMNGVELYYTQRIVMTKEWKYVYNGFDDDEMYDLKNDPGETKNLVFPDMQATCARVATGKGLQAGGAVPWPALPPHLDAVRKDLLAQMWEFAGKHHDIIFNPYGTVALAPYGPGVADGLGSVL
jgi:arylsulfatase A-like enzyme